MQVSNINRKSDDDYSACTENSNCARFCKNPKEGVTVSMQNGPGSYQEITITIKFSRQF